MGERLSTRIRRWLQLKPPALRHLLIANVAIYLLWVLGLGLIPYTRSFVIDHLALNPSLPGILSEPWQIVTYGFLHLGFGLGGLLHIVFNMLWFVWLGQEYEELYGERRMMWLYVVGAGGGGLATVLLHAAFPAVSAFGGYVHGASGAVLGIIAAVATLQPQKQIGLLFLGVWPLRLVVVVFLGLDLLFGMSGGVSVSAHLGGALAGFLFARVQAGGSSLRLVPSAPSRSGNSGVLKRLDDWLGNRGRKPARPAPRRRIEDANIVAEIDQREVDRILDKINEDGYESLSEEEKRMLYEASRH
jgi:membrane associated rhomboid family serine protease